MKKMLASLAVLSFSVSIGSQVVACMPKQGNVLPENDPLLYGKDIDKSKAIDDSKQTESGYTNYFIIGDSLSDVDGVTSFLEKKLSNLLNEMIDLDINFGGKYGWKDEKTEIWHSAFTNGKPAAYLLGEELGFGELKPSNQFFTEPYDQTEGYGNNYSVGGATAAKVGGGLMSVDDVTIDTQARTLIEQHKSSANDLVIFEIGGNDLFALNDLQTDPKKQVLLINDGLERLRKALFTLLNQGIEHVVFMTPPKMDYVSTYTDNSSGKSPVFDKDGNPIAGKEAEAEYIQDIGLEYQQRLLDLIEEIKSYYPNNFQTYDLYSDFKDLKTRFEATVADGKYNGHNAFTNKNEISIKLNGNDLELSGGLDFSSLTPEFIQNILSELVGNSEEKPKVEITISAIREEEQGNEEQNIDNYFFTDFVHPTAGVHKMVKDIFLDIVKKEVSK
ncbi:SGNH/GDSL hydrolase family protein [Spiroplasma taiwanense]|uniref:Lysophospholipase n=1 Tax=Spiroplasma taiwanense CT-1 TaxID=1276220 RepID=S5MBP9_9MOLU|nr:SGNH/GDSL hydrolase family protein [Spiroplasma taiwanense]AGR41183.1 lysophospholipase [Spiroplasma taiwanense CT-1]